jgi:hypothetical protein
LKAQLKKAKEKLLQQKNQAKEKELKEKEKMRQKEKMRKIKEKEKEKVRKEKEKEKERVRKEREKNQKEVKKERERLRKIKYIVPVGMKVMPWECFKQKDGRWMYCHIPSRTVMILLKKLGGRVEPGYHLSFGGCDFLTSKKTMAGVVMDFYCEKPEHLLALENSIREDPGGDALLKKFYDERK